MIIENLNNTGGCEQMHPLFKEAFEYLRSTNFVDAPVGKTELRGKDLFVIVSDSTLKTTKDAKLEVHNKYIDIQMPVSKAETFGWKSRQNLENPSKPFDEEKDIQFFEDEALTHFTLSPENNFAVFFPDDAHAPCIGEGIIRKIVVKIKI